MGDTEEHRGTQRNTERHREAQRGDEGVTGDMSLVTCHMSPVTRPLSLVTLLCAASQDIQYFF